MRQNLPVGDPIILGSDHKTAQRRSVDSADSAANSPLLRATDARTAELALAGRLMRAQSPMLELLEVMQHFTAVERADVARLRRRQTTHGPAQVHEVRL